MTTRRKHFPAEVLDVCDVWGDGVLEWTPEKLAELRAFAGQDMPVNENGSLTVVVGERLDEMWPGWVLHRDAKGLLGMRSEGAAAKGEELPAA